MKNVLEPSFRRASLHRSRPWAARVVVIGLAWLLSAGCKEPQDNARESAPPAAQEDRETIKSPQEAPSLAPKSSASSGASPAQSASAAPESMSFAGTWEGSYTAKKGTVELPSKVKDKTRSRDDGATGIGPGTVTLTIAPDGELSGKLSGALGAATLRGTVEGDMVRASVFPDDPAAPTAMTGVLVGMRKEGVIRGEIRVAGPDASVVRESPIELKRK